MTSAAFRLDVVDRRRPGWRSRSALVGSAAIWRGRSSGSRPSRDRERRRDEPAEQRMRPIRPALELGMELAGHEPRVVAQLDDLDQATVGRLAGQQHAAPLERVAVLVVDLEAVAMPLVDDLVAVAAAAFEPGVSLRRVEAEAHRAALVLHVALVGHEVDHRVLGEHVELGRVGVRRCRRRRGRTR